MRLDIAKLAEIEFEYVILDESQAIKNATSQVAKASRLLRGRHRLALSGTPIENHLGELWSLFEFLNPGLLGIVAIVLADVRREDARRPRRRDALAARCVRCSCAARRSRSRRSCRSASSRRSTASWKDAEEAAIRGAARSLPRRAPRPHQERRHRQGAHARSSKRCCACARPRAIRR